MTTFLHQHCRLNVEKHFMAAGLDSFWAYQLHYDDQAKASTPPFNISDPAKKGMIDYKATLNEADFTLFLKLNDLRKERAQKDAVEPFTNAQIAPGLTKEMMQKPTIFLAMMSLMQTLAKGDNPDVSAPRAALLKRLEEVATKEWLRVLRESHPEL